MRRFLLAVFGVAATLSAAAAQFGVPGQPVSSPLARPVVQPVGTRLPGAVPDVGTRVNGLATAQPNAITPGVPGMNPRPSGQPIDLSSVVAPYPNMPKQSTFWERLEQRWFALFESDAPAVRPNYTPGISRRNRDRREAEWVRRMRD